MKKIFLCVLAVMAAVAFGLTFNAAAEEGVTDTEIHIGFGIAGK